jgi:hypothetical protein
LGDIAEEVVKKFAAENKISLRKQKKLLLIVEEHLSTL